MNIGPLVQQITIAIIPLIFAITLHEAAHGYIAGKLGDQTASIMGRVTLNPLKHIDLFGTIILPLIMMMGAGFLFGWAKPVPVAWQNLKNPKRDMALVALAGPGANLLMALLWAIIAKLSYLLFSSYSTHVTVRDIATFLHFTARFGILINCALLFINLIPLPPLDGSRVVSALLPARAAMKYDRLEHYGIWIFLAIIALLYATQTLWIIWWPVGLLVRAISHLFGIPS